MFIPTVYFAVRLSQNELNVVRRFHLMTWRPSLTARLCLRCVQKIVIQLSQTSQNLFVILKRMANV